MHCKYCGHALPSSGIICPNCGKTISKEELQLQKANKLENWDEYSNQNTAKYKSEQAKDPNRVKAYLFLILVIAVLILIAVLKMV